MHEPHSTPPLELYQRLAKSTHSASQSRSLGTITHDAEETSDRPDLTQQTIGLPAR